MTLLGQALARFRRRLAALPGPDAPDAHLLERFVHGPDHAAFTPLVQRHGPLVLGLCPRILGHVQDAEDAFQATFLALARKAAGLDRQRLLGWLHGVACPVARRAALQARKRLVRVEPAGRTG
jgi:DNA-directed RNA polymerase specialized sigma24 family protein